MAACAAWVGALGQCVCICYAYKVRRVWFVSALGLRVSYPFLACQMIPFVLICPSTCLYTCVQGLYNMLSVLKDSRHVVNNGRLDMCTHFNDPRQPGCLGGGGKGGFILLPATSYWKAAIYLVLDPIQSMFSIPFKKR